MPRIPDLQEATLTSEQRVIYDEIVRGPRGVVEGPLRVWLNSPKLADRAQALGAFCRFDTSLPPRLSELAIITIGSYWRAGFEWHAHAPLAAKAGISAAAIEAIKRQDPSPPLAETDERSVHAFAYELVRERRVSEGVFADALAAIGEVALVELVGVLGYYSLISMTITAFEVAAPGGDPFA